MDRWENNNDPNSVAWISTPRNHEHPAFFFVLATCKSMCNKGTTSRKKTADSACNG